MLIFITISYLLNIVVSTTQTLSHTKSQQFIHHIKNKLYQNKSSHLCHQWHSRFCKMLYQKLGAPRPSKCSLVRSECLTCTFRASCCSARLSRAHVPVYTGSSVRYRLVTSHILCFRKKYWLQFYNSHSVMSPYGPILAPAHCFLNFLFMLLEMWYEKYFIFHSIPGNICDDKLLLILLLLLLINY